jgi:ABC-2 type transport system ATP-binding protein
LTTHYIEEAEFLADRVILINKGRILKEGRPGELMAEVGSWAVDASGQGELITSYFQSRDEAAAHIAGSRESLTIRRVNLEDAYLKATGSKI